MTEEKKNEIKNCTSKKGAMFAYGAIQLGSSVLSALALFLIALGLFSVKQEANLFVDCIITNFNMFIVNKMVD